MQLPDGDIGERPERWPVGFGYRVLGEYEQTRLYKADFSDRGKCHSPFVPSDCLLPSEPEVLGRRVRDWWMSPEFSRKRSILQIASRSLRRRPRPSVGMLVSVTNSRIGVWRIFS